MHAEEKYLLVSYRDIPDTEFICGYEDDLRIRVSKVEKSELGNIPQGSLLGAGDQLILVFENISNRFILEQDQLIRAVSWYKNKIGMKALSLIYI